MDRDIQKKIIVLIDDYARGKIKSEDIDTLWALLLEYPEYYDLLRTRVALEKKYASHPGSNSVEDQSFKPFFKNNKLVYTIAAILAVAIFSTLYITIGSNELEPAIEEIDIIHMISPDVSRSSAIELDSSEEQLHNAYIQFLAGNMDMAASELEQLREKEVFKDTVTYNLGIIHYNSREFDKAASAFSDTRCENFSRVVLRENCLWFKANAFLASGNFENAEQTANEVKEMNGIHKQDASEMVKQLNQVK